MPSQKKILTVFALSDLQATSRKLQVAVQDRRRKDALVDGLLKDKTTPFEATLSAFGATALKGACVALDLEVDGRGKAAYVATLLAAAPLKRAPQAPKGAPSKAAPHSAKAASPKASTVAPRAASKPAPPAALKAASRAAAPAASAPKTRPGARDVAPDTAPAANKEGAAAAKRLDGLKAARAAKKAKANAPAPEAAQAAVAPDDSPQAVPPEVAYQDAAAQAPEPAEKAARRGPLSWSEAALMAENRGQSAATMLRAPVPQASGSAQHTCTKCHEPVTVQACQVQACNNFYVAAPGRKICSECLFERNTISMDDFNDRLREERQCSHCGVPMTHLSSISSNA